MKYKAHLVALVDVTLPLMKDGLYLALMALMALIPVILKRDSYFA